MKKIKDYIWNKLKNPQFKYTIKFKLPRQRKPKKGRNKS